MYLKDSQACLNAPFFFTILTDWYSKWRWAKLWTKCCFMRIMSEVTSMSQTLCGSQIPTLLHEQLTVLNIEDYIKGKHHECYGALHEMTWSLISVAVYNKNRIMLHRAPSDAPVCTVPTINLYHYNRRNYTVGRKLLWCTVILKELRRALNVELSCGGWGVRCSFMQTFNRGRAESSWKVPKPPN